jgi:hypothetical protein
MTRTRVSACGRFAVLDGLHLDRNVFEFLTRWAAAHRFQIQDAIQLALCAFRDDTLDPGSPPTVPASSSQISSEPPWADRTDLTRY